MTSLVLNNRAQMFLSVIQHSNKNYNNHLKYWSFQIKSTLIISKSKGPSKTARDIRTSAYQICSIEEKTTTKFYK